MSRILQQHSRFVQQEGEFMQTEGKVSLISISFVKVCYCTVYATCSRGSMIFTRLRGRCYFLFLVSLTVTQRVTV